MIQEIDRFKVGVRTLVGTEWPVWVIAQRQSGHPTWVLVTVCNNVAERCRCYATKKALIKAFEEQRELHREDATRA